MLMLSRYLVASGRALDLATGAPIRWRARRQTRRPALPLFAARGGWWLIDSDVRGHSRIEVWEREPRGAKRIDGAGPLDTFRGALADARDGWPRALDLVEASSDTWTVTLRVLAREARLAGFVPIAVDALGAVLAQARWRWPSWLADRSLVLFTTDARVSPDGTLALFRLATRDARPHLVVRCATAGLTRPSALVSAPSHLHEAPSPGLGPPGQGEWTPEPGGASPATDLVPRAHQLADLGRLTEAEAVARWSLLLARPGAVNQPARCALARSLIGQHRLLEARAVLLPASGVEADRLRDQVREPEGAARIDSTMVEAFLGVLRICQETDDEPLALGRVCASLRETLSATSVAFVGADLRLPLVLARAGSSDPVPAQLGLALEVLDTGIARPAAEGPQPTESAWPVRYGATIVGVLWCRWVAGVPLLPQDAGALLGLASTAAAPAVHATIERTRPPLSHADQVPDLLGDSSGMQAVRDAIVRAAASPFPVLIEGESGVGKELVARAIHAASARRARRFCPLNCAALADDLVEAELFGHTRGAFTGAVAERAGLFEEAQGGTLFLDEVAELGPRVQAKLLRVLQEGEVRRVGESSVRKVDARIVAATNRSLAAEATAGRFRDDLRYRLEVIRIGIPPLRDRLEDIPALVRHLWSTLASRTGSRAVLSPSVLALLGAHDWPGNVRELQNVLATLMVAGPARGVIGPGGLPAHIARAGALSRAATLGEARRAFDARFVRAALLRAGGRQTAAARALGVSRQGLAKLMTRLQLDGEGDRAASRR